jgi:hypothetical protein
LSSSPLLSRKPVPARQHFCLLSPKALYDKVQAVIEKRGHKTPPRRNPQELCGLLRCSCGMSITAEKKVKVQKNGNRHEYIYYRCTRKNHAARCVEPAVRSEVLEKQVSDLLLEYAPKSAVVAMLEKMITDTERAETCENSSVIADFSNKIARLECKQQILLDTFLDQDIDRQTFLKKKAVILDEKQTLKESLAELSRNTNCWVEPIQNWLKTLGSICKIAKSDNLTAKKSLALEIFGLNLSLTGKTVVAFSDKKEKAVEQKPRPPFGAGFLSLSGIKKSQQKNRS